MATKISCIMETKINVFLTFPYNPEEKTNIYSIATLTVILNCMSWYISNVCLQHMDWVHHIKLLSCSNFSSSFRSHSSELFRSLHCGYMCGVQGTRYWNRNNFLFLEKSQRCSHLRIVSVIHCTAAPSWAPFTVTLSNRVSPHNISSFLFQLP